MGRGEPVGAAAVRSPGRARRPCRRARHDEPIPDAGLCARVDRPAGLPPFRSRRRRGAIRVAAGTGDGRRPPARRPGRLPLPGDHAAPGGAALVRPGNDAGLRLQPRRGRTRLPEGHRTRSRLRHVLVGRGAGAGPARQRGDGPGRQCRRLATAAARPGAGAHGQRARAGLHPGPVRALRRGPAAGPARARRGLCRGDARTGAAPSGRCRCGRIPRRGADGPAALGTTTTRSCSPRATPKCCARWSR